VVAVLRTLWCSQKRKSPWGGTRLNASLRDSKRVSEALNSEVYARLSGKGYEILNTKAVRSHKVSEVH
jgi:hypothetical protein